MSHTHIYYNTVNPVHSYQYTYTINKPLTIGQSYTHATWCQTCELSSVQTGRVKNISGIDYNKNNRRNYSGDHPKYQ